MSDAGTGQVPGLGPYQRGYRDGKAEADTRLRALNAELVASGTFASGIEAAAKEVETGNWGPISKGLAAYLRTLAPPKQS